MRSGAAAVVCGLLLAGCTESGEPSATGRPSASRAAEGGAAPSGSATASAEGPTQRADPAKLPATPGAARALIRRVIADEGTVGDGARRGTPYESDPGTWAVLGEDCAWRRAALRGDVLANLRRNFEVPGADGAAGLRLSAEVTVHRTTLDAAWEQARMQEEAIQCPEQTLGAGERLTDLTSSTYAWGEGNNTYSDDSLIESGRCVGETRGGPRPYWWIQATFGPVVVSASLCGGTERARDASVDLVQTYFTRMLRNVKDAIARPAGAPAPTASGGRGGA
ncbi:hypothetical protein [Streptomyces sp. NPDC102462]|uniref:hypothetical protein n=1 Tax=Streptomyces sp. NPDC102462 TaxID=3366178 RepID=UPI003829FB8C